ncbi:MAG: ATP-binding protein [Candidatus Rokubacteria bacterium]|nr:ATP-binding protein [Candidatus Rokubacteria bacterium]
MSTSTGATVNAVLSRIRDASTRRAEDNVAAPALTCSLCDAPAVRHGFCESHDAAVRESERRARLEKMRHRRSDWLEAIGVPPLLRSATFATSTATAAIEIVRTFVANDGVKRGRLVGLCGPTGVGKSWSVAALVDELLFNAGEAQRWMLCSTLLRDLDDYKRRDAAMGRACSGKLLVLDDFQAPGSPAVATMVEEILIRREQDRLALAFTSNLTRQALEATLPDRVLDRFRAWGEVHEVRGKSMRGR